MVNRNYFVQDNRVEKFSYDPMSSLYQSWNKIQSPIFLKPSKNMVAFETQTFKTNLK